MKMRKAGKVWGGNRCVLVFLACAACVLLAGAHFALSQPTPAVGSSEHAIEQDVNDNTNAQQPKAPHIGLRQQPTSYMPPNQPKTPAAYVGEPEEATLKLPPQTDGEGEKEETHKNLSPIPSDPPHSHKTPVV